MNMFSEIILIPAVLLAVLQVEAQPIETLGELNFTCPSGWTIHKANCYLKVDVDESFNGAKDMCSREGADLLFLKSEIEYDEVVYNMFPTKNIWMGYTTDVPLDFIQRWGNFEPKRTGTTGCIVVDPVAMRLHVGDCDERHPFVCKRRACLQGYVSCDLATKCIPQKRVCDGNMDCTDTSDELYNCPASGYQTINVNGTSSLSTGTLSAGRQKTWRLVAPIGGRIRIYISTTTLASNLAFLEIFSVAPNMQETTLIKRFTGSVDGQYIYSTNNFLTVRMYAQNVQSDVSTFNILYTSEIPDIFRDYKDLTAASSWEQLVFPFQDEINKPAMLELRWRITAPVGQVITYYLEKIDSSKAMEADIMSTDGKMYMDGLYVSGTNTVDIILKNVPSNTKLHYKTGCGLTTSRKYGVIFSPKFMGSIPNNIMCSWTLDGGQQVGRGMSVKFNTDFTADPRTAPGIRSEDYITVTADGSTAKVVANYSDRIYSSSSGMVIISFTSDAALNSRFFEIVFATDCPALAVSSDTNKSKNSSVFEEDVELSCRTGYKFHLEKYSKQRSLNLTCGRDQQWYIGKTKLAAIPECRVVYCGTPRKIENGYIVMATRATYNSVAMYSCVKGFVMAEQKNATCDENGDWVNTPKCDSATCNELLDDMLPNGSLNITAGNKFENGKADFNTVVQFYCKPGFELLGPVRTRCTDAGWTHTSTPPSCARLPCTRPDLKNGNITGNTKPVYGDTLSATCYAGFKLNTGASSMILTCGAYQQFDTVTTCQDVNECFDGSNNCDTDTTLCNNTEGSFKCECRAGYTANNGTACSDIQECATDNGGCSHNCAETPPGSYSCSCPDGYVLFGIDGDQGFSIPSPENGTMPGDVYRKGHTCVPKKCPSLPALDNGQYLTNKTAFHSGDSVKVHCNDGYYLNGRNSTDATIKCHNNATWTETLSCQARSCDMPTAHSHGSFNVTSVLFLETVTLTCKLTETKHINKSAVCVYISKTAGMRLAGDNLTTCPEIDCGYPSTVLPSGAGIAQPSTTTYLASTSTFVFACKPGESITGQSESNNTNVVCKANGRWSLGTLSCSGKMCSDPGTPGGMRQVATGYNVGATLSYQCVRSGFEPSGPHNYTCQYNASTGSAVWSDDLARSLPTCQDREKPVFTTCPDYSDDYFYGMGTVNFTTPVYKDNYGIKNLSSSGSYLHSGDVLSPHKNQTSISYTVQDYGGNTVTCSYTFNVYDKSVMPNITCPPQETVTVSDRNGVSKNVSSWVSKTDRPHHNTSLSFSPTVVTGTVSKIGTSEEVTATALFTSGPNINAQRQCKFLVNFVAGACFQEQLFSDPNSVRNCTTGAAGSLVCTSTCNSGYVYGDGDTVKTFTCTGANTWDYNTSEPANRFCLPIQSSDDTIASEVVYDFTSNSFQCTTQFASKLAPQLSTFGTRLSSSCEGLSWTATNTNNKLQSSNQFVATFLLTLQVPNLDTAKKNRCLQTIRSTPSLFNLTDTQLICSDTRTGTLSVNSLTAGGIVVKCKDNIHQKVSSASLSADVCVPCGQGHYYSSSAGSCQRCPTGQYQDTTGQSQCKQCSAGYYPNTDQTQCQRSCWAGYSSSTGFYPCSVCPVDTYWVNKTLCVACPNDGSTVGVVGATSSSPCYEPCPVGTYSSSGYKNMACLSCPHNFYQDMTGQTECIPCGEQQTTTGTGSTAVANCTAIGVCDNATHCSGHGTCSIQNHRHVCTCDTGYYGTTCASMFHICDANPCTNGGTCVRGAGPEDYTCACPVKYDVCDMGVGSVDKIGDTSAPIIGDDVVSVNNVDQCKQLCLQNTKCLEASFAPTGVGSSFCYLYNTSVALVNGTVAGSAHFKKSCTEGFLGQNCEKDNVDNCKSAGCQNNAVCVDMVGTFKCNCPSASITGTLCNVTTVPCASSPCKHGTCTSHDIARYECTCPDGYTGLQCETYINECETTECLHGGTCNDTVNGYVCVCRDGFTGNNCENVPNFCKAGDCKERNVCYSSLDKMDGLCVCDANFFEPVYICTFTQTANTQIKDAQQFREPVAVTSVKECEDLCQRMPECRYAQHELLSSGAMWCSFYNTSTISNQSQTNYIVLRKDCPTSGDAYDCHRKSRPCDTSPCKNGAICTDDGFVATCACAAGYTGSRCQHNIDDCANHGCQNGATCMDGNRIYTCKCAPGYNGLRCQNNINECPGQCNSNHGVCEDKVNGYFCNCSRGYTGTNCETDINACLSNPCKHQGTCVDQVNDYHCVCPVGWTGKDCNPEIDYCANRSCQNNGECFNLPGTSFCRCEGGASGENCENATKVCDILSNILVCTNTGNCTNKPGTAECTCPKDYSGVSCQFVKDWCSLTGEAYPCKNDGQCVPVESRGYTCICKPGYAGPTCTTVADPCLSNPCGGGAACTDTVTDYICQCPQGKTLSGNQCLGDSSPHVIIVNTLYITSPPVLQSPFRWTNGNLSVMLWVRVHYTEGQNLSSLFSIWLSPRLHPSFFNEMYDYGFIVNTMGIYAARSTNWTGITFTNDFGGNLHDGEWHHLGVAITSEGKMSATIDAIAFGDEVDVDPLPASAQNGQVSLGYQYLAEYERLTVWNRSLSNVDFAVAYAERTEATEDLIQGWYNYDLKYSAARMSNRLPGNLLANPNLKFPKMQCGDPDFKHVSTDRIVGRETFSSIVDNLTAGNNQALKFKNSLMASMTWGYYEAIFVGIDSTTEHYGECRTQTFIQYNDSCPNPVKDTSVTVGTCPSTNSDAVCNVTCVQPNNTALFAPLPRYMVCSPVGVWWSKKPHENLILPGCSTKSLPSYKVTSEMKFAAVINCDSLPNGTLGTEVGAKLQDALSALSLKWTGICKRSASTPPNTCDNLEIIDKTCQNGTKIYHVKFAVTFDSQTMTSADGGQVSVLDGMRIIIQLEKDLDAHFKKIASSVIQPDSVVISMTEVCGSGYALVKDDTGSHCVPCGAGWRLDSLSKQCVPCDYGYYQPTSAQTTCLKCPNPNTITYSKGSKAASDCVVSCPAGQSFSATSRSCSDCPRHYYQDETGKDFCKPCPIGYKTVSAGSNSKTQCTEDCHPGYTRDPSDITKCIRCSRGTYRNTQDDCQTCSAGRYTLKDTVAVDNNDCKMGNCTVGQYWSIANTTCTPCPFGEYQDTLYQLQCKRCNDSYSTENTNSTEASACKFFCPVGTEEKTPGQCTPCERGFYKDNAGNDKFLKCKACDSMKTTETTGATSRDMCSIPVCSGGQYIKNGVCEPCSIDFFSDVNLPNSNTTCVTCSGSDGMYGTKTNGSTSTHCERYCPPGQDLNGTTCVDCERGFYKDNTGSGRFEACKQCPSSDGKQTTTDATGANSTVLCKVYACTIGQISTANGCTACPADTYQNMTKPFSYTTCSPCPTQGQLSTGTKQTASTMVSQCEVFCRSGYVLNVTISGCVPCARGTYKDNADSLARFNTSCTPCSSGFTTETTASTSAGNCSIPKCVAGKFINSSKECAPCPMDTYSSDSHPTSTTTCQNCTECANCGPTKGTTTVGANSTDMCLPVCGGGKQYSSSVKDCELCHQGQFKQASNRFGQCQNCTNINFTTVGQGSTSDAQCTLRACAPGFKINGANCDACPYGTYQNTSYQDFCYKCRENTNTSQIGSTSENDCQIYCGVGLETNQAGDSCTLCPEHKFKAEAGVAACKDCSTDLTSNQARTACDTVYCAAGRQQNTTGCNPCPVHQYKPSAGNTNCQPCPAGMTSLNVGGTACTSTWCMPGNTLVNSSCQPCGTGTYKEAHGNDACTSCAVSYTTTGTGATSVTHCDTIICPAGRFRNPSQKTACTVCPLDTYQSTAGTTSCIQCEPGKITLQHASTSLENCIPKCNAGQQYNPNPKTCFNCPKGTYKSASGNYHNAETLIECQACPENTTTMGERSISAANCTETVCPMGTYYKVVDSKTQCIVCPVGKYSDVKNLAECKQCPAGNTTFDTGNVNLESCIDDCKIGKGYSSASGQCEICPTGEYNDKKGLNPNLCKKCPPYFTSTQPESEKCLVPVDNAPKEISIDITIQIKYRIAIESCSLEDVLRNILVQIVSRMKSVFALKNSKRFGLSKGLCRGISCDNLDLVSVINCASFGSGRKRRDINTELELEFKFKNISSYVTDTADNSSVTAEDAVAQILVEAAVDKELNPVKDVIEYYKFDNVSVVELCSPGQENINNTCKDCPAGKYGSDGKQCSPCGTNQFQNMAGQSSCQQCPAGTLNVNTGSTSVIDCLPLCGPGHEFNNASKQCDKCPAGRYKSTSGNVDACVSCPNGTTTTGQGSTSRDMCNETSCEPGQTLVGGKCVLCEVGKYKSAAGNHPCTSCDEGWTSAGNGSTSQAQCDIKICPVGQFREPSQKTVCKPCAKDSYQPTTGMTACILCTPGKITLGTASTSVSDCVTECVPGHFYETVSGAIRCTPCPKGSFSSERMVSQCTKCSEGNSTEFTGATSANDCTTDCPLGQGLNLVTKVCVKCPINQYNNKTGNNPNLCKFCPTGKTNAQTGQSNCPLDTTSPLERRFVNIRLKLKYKIAIEDCTVSVSSFRTVIGKTLRDLFVSYKTSRYHGAYSFCPNQCENIIVQEDPASCVSIGVSGRRKREVNHGYEFTVTFNNVSNQIPDPTDGNKEVATSDVIAQILSYNQSILTPTELAAVLQYVSNDGLTAVGICGDGMQWSDNACVPCPLGYSGTSGVCQKCGADTYQDTTGQTSCTICPENTFHNDTGATGVQSCKDFCTVNPLYCNNGGRCVTTGRRTGTCNCYDEYEGARCNSKKEPQSNLPVILGAAIGGGGGLLVLILVIVGVYRYLSVKDRRNEKSRYAIERNGMDDYNAPVYYDNPVGNLGRIPAIGYPTSGHPLKETSFDHGSQTGAYRWSEREGRAEWDTYGHEPQTTWES